MKPSVETVNAFIDTVIKHAEVKNDAALCRLLDVAPPVISKIRHGHIGVSGDLKIIIHEKTGISIADIQAALAS
jgi:hypothetical protein